MSNLSKANTRQKVLDEMVAGILRTQSVLVAVNMSVGLVHTKNYNCTSQNAVRLKLPEIQNKYLKRIKILFCGGKNKLNTLRAGDADLSF